MKSREPVFLCPSPRSALTFLAAFLLGCGSAQADRIVTVRSTVEPGYSPPRSTESRSVKTYVFARGQCFDPIPMDSHLRHMDFRTIATTLATDMKPHGFEPARDLVSADLVLVVHWGVTMENPNPASFLLQDYDVLREASNAMGDAMSDANRASEVMVTPNNAGVLEAVVETQINLRRESAVSGLMSERNATRGHTNAELLGLQASLVDAEKMPFSNAMGEAVRVMVNEERYFIIVIAYDARALREGRKRRLWTTRTSIRAAGVNFAIALDRLSETSAEFHGTPQTGLLLETSGKRTTPLKAGSVQVGEIKVIGDDAMPPRKKP